MYVNDTAFYYGSKNMDTLKQKLQDDIVNVRDWLKSSKLSLTSQRQLLWFYVANRNVNNLKQIPLL